MTIVLVPRYPQAGKIVTVHARYTPATPPLPNDVHLDVRKPDGTWDPVVGYDHAIPAESGNPTDGVNITFAPTPPKFPGPGSYQTRIRWTRNGRSIRTGQFILRG